MVLARYQYRYRGQNYRSRSCNTEARAARGSEGEDCVRLRQALHIAVILSKATLSGQSVCLRARAPCPLRVTCLRIVLPDRGVQQGLQACVPVAPWDKTCSIKYTHSPNCPVPTQKHNTVTARNVHNPPSTSPAWQRGEPS